MWSAGQPDPLAERLLDLAAVEVAAAAGDLDLAGQVAPSVAEGWQHSRAAPADQESDRMKKRKCFVSEQVFQGNTVYTGLDITESPIVTNWQGNLRVWQAI